MRLSTISKPLILFALLAGCSNADKRYSPDALLAGPRQSKIIWQVVHFSAKLPPTGTVQTRFDQQFASYYENVATEYHILYCSAARADSSYYFLITRPARSIQPMSEGIGGIMTINWKDSLMLYNEIFRTWKMPEDTLTKRGLVLFEHMIHGKDLSIYYPKYAGDKYIEFPDERFTFDTVSRVWKDKVMDSVVVR